MDMNTNNNKSGARARARTHTHTHTYRLVSFRKDSSPNPFHSNTTLWHSHTRFISLKLIYII